MIREGALFSVKIKKCLILLGGAIWLTLFSQQTLLGQDHESWQKRAQNVTIFRDDWGIPHVYGKTDADTVFGLIYAQAEDDFNRVETNYLNALGRLAEAEGEAAVYADLRMKMFIDPEQMKELYGRGPHWLKALMDALAMASTIT